MRVELNAYLNIMVNMLGFIQASMASVGTQLGGGSVEASNFVRSNIC